MSEESDIDAKKMADKETAFYAALVNGWLTTLHEKDKQLLTISCLAIGFLMLIPANGQYQVIFFILAALPFLLCIVTILLFIFNLNAKKIEHTIANDIEKSAETSGQMKVLDILSTSLFCCGLILTVAYYLYFKININCNII
jgi:hypothetical protein